MQAKVLLAGIAFPLMIASGGTGAALEGPIPILCGGRTIDTEHVGHAAPCVADFDGGGRKDLPVGEMYQGRLRIYRNAGSNDSPRFAGFSVFQDGVPEGRVPAG